jgi:hypothetical protein
MNGQGGALPVRSELTTGLDTLPQKLDWSMMILRLNATGMTLGEIAKFVGVTTNALYYIKNGGRKTIRWNTGAAIYNLYQQKVLGHGKTDTGA